MASKIILKKSSVTGKVPLSADLEYGEVALNYADGKLYFKNTSNSVQSISAGALGVDSAATIALINSEIDSDWITSRVISAIPTGVDSAATIALIDSAYIQYRIDKPFINSLDVNAGTLDGHDGTYYLNYNNFTNTPQIGDFNDSAFVNSVLANANLSADSATIRSTVDSAFIATLVNDNYVATIVDSAYVALRVGDFANNFGTVAVVGDLSIDATTGGDTITLAAGANVTISSDINQKKITIASTPNQVFDFGTFTAPVGFSLDMGAF